MAYSTYTNHVSIHHQIQLSHIAHTSIITYCIYTNYHITSMWLKCKTCDSMHVVPNVNPMFHRFPIQYLESKPHLRSGQDQGHQYEHIVHRFYFHSRIKANNRFTTQPGYDQHNNRFTTQPGYDQQSWMHVQLTQHMQLRLSHQS